MEVVFGGPGGDLVEERLDCLYGDLDVGVGGGDGRIVGVIDDLCVRVGGCRYVSGVDVEECR